MGNKAPMGGDADDKPETEVEEQAAEETPAEEPVQEKTPAPEPESKKYLTIAQVRSAPDLEPFDVDVPKWGGSVKCRPLTVDQRHEMRTKASHREQNPAGDWEVVYDDSKMQLEAIVLGVIEPKFNRSDIEWLRSTKDGAVIQSIALRILQASGMEENAEKKQDSGS